MQAVLAVLLVAFAASVARAVPFDRFIVRSAPFAGKREVAMLSNSLSEHGFHPVIQTDKAGGNEYYYLEMGGFDNLEKAMDLLMLLKNLGFDFFIEGGNGAGGAGGTASSALVAKSKTTQLFPFDGDPVADQFDLLAAVPMPGGPPMPAPPWATGQNPDATGLQKNTTPKVLQGPVRPDVPEMSNVGKQLQSMAWTLRGKGFGVFFDQESYQTPEGVLVGVFEDLRDAEDLKLELQDYGYTTKIQNDMIEKTPVFYVYAVVDDIPPPMIRVEQGDKPDSGNKETFSPPGDDSMDTLLKLTKPRKRVKIID